MHICMYVCVPYSGGRRSQGLACVASAHLYPESSVVLRQDFTMGSWLDLNSRSSYLCLPSVGIIGLNCHSQLSSDCY